MIEKIQKIIERFEEINLSLADPDVIKNQDQVKELAQERSQIEQIAELGREYIRIIRQIEEVQDILKDTDSELKELAREEIDPLEKEKVRIEEKIKILLIPKDPNENKNIIIEIRAGTGGDEAALFVADLFRMYTRFSERKRWKYEVLDSNETGIGGLKEIVFSISGKGVYGLMKYESGVHRVQRVPKTEASGRIHTSASTVAVLPEAEEADVDIRNEDLKIDTYRASGAGGQHVNKTESAIRITHIPSGLIVTCQDEKSQHKNRSAAMKVLRSRLLALEQERLAKERAKERKSLVSTGDRSAKIRTYNFPQGRLTDHRINYTSYRLEQMLDGDLLDLIDQLRLADQQSQMMAE
ncbi:MAG: peptide chain release factor 1 [Candidatus Neomarinimicrobiota bacterium]